MPRVRFDRLATERDDPRSRDLDRLSAVRAVRFLIDAERRSVAAALRAAPRLAAAVELAAGALERGGRLILVGAGTSGRLAVLEAAECPPTFNTRPGQVQAVMAGGRAAVFRSREGAEDDVAAARRAMRARVRRGDVVVGIAASGVTPFVQASLQAARARGARTVFVTCNPDIPRGPADVVVTLAVGPEALAGSTRLKAGTASKLALNALTTATFVRLGKVHGNRMVDVMPRSAKLRARAERLVAELGGVGRARAGRLLAAARGRATVAIVMARLGVTRSAAERRLAKVGGRLRAALAATREQARRSGRALGPRGRR
jgi:N-acetylmuramic acid 6-phosphate etherase